MAKNITIYHNPRCSKSREALALLQARDFKPTIIEYLQTPLNKNQLKNLAKILALHPRELIRNNETEYKTMRLADPKLTQDKLLQALVNCPKLLQRPIVVVDNKKAVIGRAPEKIWEIIK